MPPSLEGGKNQSFDGESMVILGNFRCENLEKYPFIRVIFCHNVESLVTVYNVIAWSFIDGILCIWYRDFDTHDIVLRKYHSDIKYVVEY